MKHTVGNWYKCDGEFYILAQILTRQFCLVGLNGNRWSDPVTCKPINHWPLTISEDDFKQISRSWNHDVQLVKKSIINRPQWMIDDCSIED